MVLEEGHITPEALEEFQRRICPTYNSRYTYRIRAIYKSSKALLVP